MTPELLAQLLGSAMKTKGGQALILDMLTKHLAGGTGTKAVQDMDGDGDIDSRDDKVAAEQAKQRKASVNKGPGVGAYVKNTGGYVFDLLGRLLQGGGLATQALLGAGGVAGGALGNAALKIPSAAISALQSPRQREMYGSGIFGAAGDVGSTLGDGVGVALPALGAGAGSAVGALTGAGGTWVQDLGNALKLSAANDFIDNQLRQSAAAVQEATGGNSPTQNELTGKVVTAKKESQRGLN